MSEYQSNVAVEPGSERSFGLVFCAVFALVACYPLTRSGGGIRMWALALSVMFLALALFVPKTLQLPNRLWFKLGLLLGKIVGRIVMALLYVFAIAPTGLVMRMLGKDILRLRIDKEAQSYWLKRNEPVGSMKNQF